MLSFQQSTGIGGEGLERDGEASRGGGGRATQPGDGAAKVKHPRRMSRMLLKPPYSRCEALLAHAVYAVAVLVFLWAKHAEHEALLRMF